MDFQNFKEKYQKKDPEEYRNQVNSKPVVSVLVQTYQHEKYIRECLDGILKQTTDFPVEILLGEDGSDDRTREICFEYAEIYPEKIRLFLHQPENKIKVSGVTTGNFNALYNFFESRGKYIAYCEGDDVWTDPLKLQKQVERLEGNSSLVLTYHSYHEVNEELKPLSAKMSLEQPKGNLHQEDLQRLNFHPLLSTICFRNSIKDNLPGQLVEVINVDSFLISLLGNYGEGGFLEEIEPSFYRRHVGGIWSRRRKTLKMDSKLQTYQKLVEFYVQQGKNDIADCFERKILNVHKMLAYHFLRNGNLLKAAEHLRRSL